MTTETASRTAFFEAISAVAQTQRAVDLRRAHAQSPSRAEDLTFEADGLVADLSRAWIDPSAVAYLCTAAQAAGIERARDAQLAGARVNTTEDRAALHSALRWPTGAAGERWRTALAERADAHGISTARSGNDQSLAEYHAEANRGRDAMCALADAVRNGTMRGCTGQAFTDVINLGIGGSDLGPALLVDALSGADGPRPRIHFV
ncbi:MAG: hypothetical protein AAGF32_00400, partial [Pseudomonadota bacterium]